ncbi:HD domain-containing phosphohydrolase [Azospirillum sp. TSO22-1]|uniref:HD-GYP domain-containing protein n=1 Tax=Azospirillum sp. TSO22-1 TaxID=716789 RepID=UPI000D65291A|nr:HD domain-containing phosphohydrolase [Azospirillum sp. TSO22-1]
MSSRTLHAQQRAFERALLEQNIQIAQVLGKAIAMRDHDTGDHNLRVALYAGLLGDAIGLDPQPVRDLMVGAYLHDLGKIAIPDRILLKAGPLSSAEWEVIRRHCDLGAQLLGQMPAFHYAIPVVRHHHERYDGTGYPDRLTGEDIPLIARAFAVVDVFDALVSVRPYKRAMAFEDALDCLEAGKGTHFDPTLAAAFIRLAPHLYHTFGNLSEDELAPYLDNLRLRLFGA